MNSEPLKFVTLKLVLALIFAFCLFYSLFYFIGDWIEKSNPQGFSFSAFLLGVMLFLILALGVIFYISINKKGILRIIAVLIGLASLGFTFFGFFKAFA